MNMPLMVRVFSNTLMLLNLKVFYEDTLGRAKARLVIVLVRASHSNGTATFVALNEKGWNTSLSNIGTASQWDSYPHRFQNHPSVCLRTFVLCFEPQLAVLFIFLRLPP